MRIPDTLAIILAGGAGTRLGCLTNHRAKAVLPVGGTHRLIDISLSNLAHSHISNIGIVEQYLPEPLNAYVAGGRPWDLDRNHGGLQILPPFEGAKGEGFSRGNADALFRQADFIRERDPQFVLVMSADQIYTMNYLDVVTTELDEDVSRYGVVQADEHARVKAFDYKPEEPIGNVVTTEVFLYRADALLEAMEILASKGDLGDYGDTLVPWFVENRKVVEHRHTGYWLDLGTIQSYWTANMQLIDDNGASLDDPLWPIWSAPPQLVPARIDEGAVVSRSLLSNGTTIGGEVHHSIVGTGSVVEPGASVRNCVLLDGVRVASGVHLLNCVVDSKADIQGGTKRGSEDAITVIDRTGKVDHREKFDAASMLPDGVTAG